MTTFGTPSGWQRKTEGSFSLPGTALGPSCGYVVSNRACPQGVSGGRAFSSMAPEPGYSIHMPDKSCDRAAGVAESLAGSDCSLVCAKSAGENASATNR